MIELILGGFVALILLIAPVWLIFRPGWMGFAEKTLWDWMVILSLPAMVSFGAVAVSAIAREIESERSEEVAVQQFIDRISGAYASGVPDRTVLAVARAQTIAVLRLVSGERAGRALNFLNDLGALAEISPNLEFLDLSKIELKGLPLAGFDFEGSDLRDAELEGTDLTGADFEESDLRGADMKDAVAKGASFENARMKGADLDHADLRGADLGSAIGLDDSQLGRACIDETTLLPPDIEAPLFNGPGCTGRAEDD